MDLLKGEYMYSYVVTGECRTRRGPVFYADGSVRASSAHAAIYRAAVLAEEMAICAKGRGIVFIAVRVARTIDVGRKGLIWTGNRPGLRK